MPPHDEGDAGADEGVLDDEREEVGGALQQDLPQQVLVVAKAESLLKFDRSITSHCFAQGLKLNFKAICTCAFS